ncbi:MAG: divergent polysaccharide deacetylase family protein, partial [Zetaproteobacteria bacterium]
GSALTERWAPMRALMRGIAGRRLFFVDSLTSPRSVAADAAAEAGVPWAQRTLFLDHDPRPAAIKRQWAEALRCAEKALCVVIAHPHPETLAFLRRTLAEAPLVAITEALHPGAYALASHAR